MCSILVGSLLVIRGTNKNTKQVQIILYLIKISENKNDEKFLITNLNNN